MGEWHTGFLWGYVVADIQTILFVLWIRKK
jgi:hypothetical protein